MNAKRLVLAGVLALALGNVCRADVIAEYCADFAGTTPNTGWSYLSNSLGAIGTATNYDSLIWNATNSGYAGSATTYPGGDDPTDSYVLMQQPTTEYKGIIYPGLAAGDTLENTWGWSVYAIAAYEVQPDEGGAGSIVNSVLAPQVRSAGGDLRVYVNNVLKEHLVMTENTAYHFDGELGTLAPGDTVYVAYGPNASMSTTGIAYWFNYQIQTSPIPEPGTIIMLSSGLLGLLAYAWRKRR